jgi:hypothetical protein
MWALCRDIMTDCLTSAAIVSLVRGIIFYIGRNHTFNLAYANYLDIILTATETSAGLMCACLPLTKPIIIRFTKWLQSLHILDSNIKGWTTLSESTKTAQDNSRTITRTKDYHVQLLPMADVANSQTSTLVGAVDKPWQSVGAYKTTVCCESVSHRDPSHADKQWEMQLTWGSGKQ